MVRALLEEWLKKPKDLAQALGLDEEELKKLTPEELLQYFLDRLKEQTEEHHGGNKWIGTGGTSPVGHSGYSPGGHAGRGHIGEQVGHQSGHGTEIQGLFPGRPAYPVSDRRGLETTPAYGAGGPKDMVNIDKTIYQTMKNAGEIEIIFDRSLKDRLKVILAIDNGGWSMDPYIGLVQTLFNYARAQFKDLKTFFFHNTIYDYLWEDPPRRVQALSHRSTGPSGSGNPVYYRRRCQYGPL